MSGRHGLRVIVIALLASAGCDGLSERPGHDFSVRLVDWSTSVVGQIYAPVRFAVDGCAAFDLDLDNERGARQALTFTKQSDGAFEAAVPVAALWGPYDCGTQNPWGTLVVTCKDAGRRATMDVQFFISNYVGPRAWHGDVRTIISSGDSEHPGSPWSISTASTTDWDGSVNLPWDRFLHAEWRPFLNLAEMRHPLVRPRLARNGDRAFATLGCGTYPDCPPVSIGPGESAPGERLADIGLTDEKFAPPRGVAHVSTSVVDMAFAEDGALVVISDGGNAWKGTESIVWRVVPAPEGAQGVVEDEATVIARLPREAVSTRLSRTVSGALMFATIAYPERGSLSLKLYVTDGSTVTTRRAVPSDGSDPDVPWGFGMELYEDPDGLWPISNRGTFLSPDGSEMIVVTELQNGISGGRPYRISTDPADRIWDPLPYWDSQYNPWANGGAVWLPGAVALWTGGNIMVPEDTRAPSVVRVYDATAPHALRYEYQVEALPGATVSAYLVGLVAIGDHLVLTTSTGLRILDADGKLVGGADPLPCGARTTAAAEQIGPTWVAVGVGEVIWQFEVGP